MSGADHDDAPEDGGERPEEASRVETVFEEPADLGEEALEPPAAGEGPVARTIAEGPPMRHDPREVRRVVAMAFSVGELSKFAERWRVFIDRQGSIDDAARQLVRAVEARDKLGQLVESLRSHKPLFEWPEPSIVVEAGPPAPPPPAPARDLRTPGGDGVKEGSAPLRPPIVDPYQAGSDEPAADGVVVPIRWLWLGLGVLVAMGAAAGVTYALVGGEDAPADQGPVAFAAAAADEIGRTVKALAEACHADPDPDSARDQLESAFHNCDAPPPSGRPTATVPFGIAPKPPPPAPVGAPPVPRPPVSRAPVCLDTCHRVHNECKESQCGAEPRSAQEYQAYQRCLSTCLAAYSRCRLTCN
ncbi:MAG: hypothetical protein R3B72_17830 [Polyangiaceae bacterium]